MYRRQFMNFGTKSKITALWTTISDSRNVYNLQKLCRKFSTSHAFEPKICVIGAGPAGFYASQHILKTLPNARIDIIEKLPVPFGLVRFGVAPDHPEVKNVINTFTKVAENPRVRFIGNLSLGKDVSLRDVRNAYNAVVLCYGAEEDRKMRINDEDKNTLSARKFVAWYNGLPDCEESYESIENQLRNSETVTLIGQGNVAVDVARILLSPIDALRKTDITSRALSTLAESNIRMVHLVGRRGPLQAAFTIKELREMLNLPNVSTIWRTTDFIGIDEQFVGRLPRPKKRITELMLKNVHASVDTTSSTSKYFSPIFFRSPIHVEHDNSNNEKRLRLTVNRLSETEAAIPTNDAETLHTNLILRSIGYKSVNVITHSDDELLNFDTSKGLVRNEHGRVLKLIEQNSVDASSVDDKYERGLYASGWLGTGPTGVILTTMSNSFLVAKNLCDDIQAKRIDCSTKSGLDIKKYTTAITWNDWLKIDKFETEMGAQSGKPREKLLHTSKMLEILK
ncbi:NADPH:adrenodoxin oxidoreductase, mitochondrial [Contarinia nasturtii]|uniref:NADPH:adrenodoxin oxidoreductase, mitochondrial n=1 Tax=Contarinia nasturtii TaxID=265458 RepID=UPI0012D47274|nr:NADPH:adrenodoxin oxidoreductase, mitochondrial [Contarinia nasturtii]XP_031640786.1 NADPH:adrenodoxin oxidoreductase, mitochondrial [Contarinia nasturtii]